MSLARCQRGAAPGHGTRQSPGVLGNNLGPARLCALTQRALLRGQSALYHRRPRSLRESSALLETGRSPLCRGSSRHGGARGTRLDRDLLDSQGTLGAAPRPDERKALCAGNLRHRPTVRRALDCMGASCPRIPATCPADPRATPDLECRADCGMDAHQWTRDRTQCAADRDQRTPGCAAGGPPGCLPHHGRYAAPGSSILLWLHASDEPEHRSSAGRELRLCHNL